jgi:hypothetical protein
MQSNDEIIQAWTPETLRKINEAEIAMGIKHNRSLQPRPIKAKFRRTNGEIDRIAFNLNKGLIMTHKGAGAYPENRVAKPFFNNTLEKTIPDLADQLAASTGDFLAGHIFIQ